MKRFLFILVIFHLMVISPASRCLLILLGLFSQFEPFNLTSNTIMLICVLNFQGFHIFKYFHFHLMSNMFKNYYNYNSALSVFNSNVLGMFLVLYSVFPRSIYFLPCQYVCLCMYICVCI